MVGERFLLGQVVGNPTKSHKLFLSLQSVIMSRPIDRCLRSGLICAEDMSCAAVGLVTANELLNPEVFLTRKVVRLKQLAAINYFVL